MRHIKRLNSFVETFFMDGAESEEEGEENGKLSGTSPPEHPQLSRSYTYSLPALTIGRGSRTEATVYNNPLGTSFPGITPPKEVTSPSSATALLPDSLAFLPLIHGQPQQATPFSELSQDEDAASCYQLGEQRHSRNS